LTPPAARLPTMEDRLPLLPLLALGWDVGEGARRPAQARASSPEEGPTTERGHSGQPVGQNERGGRKRARLRWRKKDQGHSKRHLLVDTQGLVLEVRVHSAKVMDLKTASSSCWILSPPIACLVCGTCGWRRGLQRPRQGRRLGAKDDGVDGLEDRAPSTEAGS
jgi:hypothetical protein